MVGGAHPTGEIRDEGAFCQRENKTVDLRKSTLLNAKSGREEGALKCTLPGDEKMVGRSIGRIIKNVRSTYSG
jgi:hypothetical protein